MGEIPRTLLQSVKDHLTSTGFEVEISHPRSVPTHAYNAQRGQYKARTFIEMAPRTGGYHLVITDVDLYVPNYNFVFGLASGNNAVISIARLAGKLLQERTIKEAVHELGHLLGLVHCENPECVMCFSNTLADTDRKGTNFCEKCQKKLI
jgi:archaemetzincin